MISELNIQNSHIYYAVVSHLLVIAVVKWLHNRCPVTQCTCNHRLTSHSNATLYRVANMTHIVITDSETTHTLLCSAAQGSEFHMYSVA